ncbi:hypothetical protein TNIN_362811 [Trichonephila inaurata madagascariensis]|uniref:Uncharacterized protein n=1 Tax=Trichonephila inaurata madagascariensis TaxID=2747483 RepID=A0A8X7BQD6_9ARAC|nr:hypothetical protein TNIN_362811 [Trichonephila inaurata madagascariensis]
MVYSLSDKSVIYVIHSDICDVIVSFLIQATRWTTFPVPRQTNLRALCRRSSAYLCLPPWPAPISDLWDWDCGLETSDLTLSSSLQPPQLPCCTPITHPRSSRGPLLPLRAPTAECCPLTIRRPRRSSDLSLTSPTASRSLYSDWGLRIPT